MNSRFRKVVKTWNRTGCCCAEFLNSKSQNPRIRSNTTYKEKNRKPEGESQPGKPGRATTPGEEVVSNTQCSSRTWILFFSFICMKDSQSFTSTFTLFLITFVEQLSVRPDLWPRSCIKKLLKTWQDSFTRDMSKSLWKCLSITYMYCNPFKLSIVYSC